MFFFFFVRGKETLSLWRKGKRVWLAIWYSSAELAQGDTVFLCNSLLQYSSAGLAQGEKGFGSQYCTPPPVWRKGIRRVQVGGSPMSFLSIVLTVEGVSE